MSSSWTTSIRESSTPSRPRATTTNRYYLDARRIVLRRFRIEHFGDGRVAGQAWGEPRAPLKHRPKVIVKGVTYHQLKIEQRPDGWQVQVFLDI